MHYSTCCGAETTMSEIDICPECLEHCDFDYLDDQIELTNISKHKLNIDEQHEQSKINEHE